MGEDLCAQFEREGYVIVKQVIDPQTVQALRSFFLPVFQREKTNVLPDAVLQYPQIRNVLKSSKLVQALTTLLGKPFTVPPHSSVECNRFGVFHTDMTGAEMNQETFHKNKAFRMVTVAVYLQDNNEYGGGIRLAPGTHTQPDPYVELTRQKASFRQQFNQSSLKRALKKLSRGRLYDWDKPFREHEHGVDIQSNAGDAIIWDMRMVHRASPPRVKGSAPHKEKLAIFFTCGANNSITTQAYMKYTTSLPENAHLQKTRINHEMLRATSSPEFIVL